MASGRNNAARKYEDQVPAQREVQPKRHLQVAAAPVKKKKHRRKPAVMQLSLIHISEPTRPY